jgi:thiol-disulfide isomerase/thioredoxin
VSVAGLVVLLGLLAAATAYGLVRQRRSGALRAARSAEEHLSAADLGRPLGDRATLVQFSSAFCRPCVATRHVLAGAAAELPGVAHVEVDAESHLELVRRLGVASTPSTLVLDGAGVERRRATGVPRRAEVVAAVADVLEGGGQR